MKRETVIEILSKEPFARLSKKEKKAVEYVIKNRVPVLFVGGVRAGKTTLAKALRELGIAAYAPEDLSVIELGAKEDEVTVNENDKGYPVLRARDYGEPLRWIKISPQDYKCPVCGRSKAYASNYCPNCGQRLLPPETKNERNAQ